MRVTRLFTIVSWLLSACSSVFGFSASKRVFPANGHTGEALQKVYGRNLFVKLGATSPSSFDFSASSEWETFYKEHPDVFEWHSSVPLEHIASYVPAHSDASVLLVGCGNSRLPAVLLATCPNANVVLLDTSQTCLDQLQDIYGDSVEYVCGNAVQLDRCFGEGGIVLAEGKEAIIRKFDMIIDKGLSDAFFCSEGWNDPIERLYRRASTILKPHGKYLLISYRLQSSTQEFLAEIGEDTNMKWSFDIPEDSNKRVGVSLATIAC